MTYYATSGTLALDHHGGLWSTDGPEDAEPRFLGRVENPHDLPCGTGGDYATLWGEWLDGQRFAEGCAAAARGAYYGGLLS